MLLNDVHCHFFSSAFLELLTRDLPGWPVEGRATAGSHRLGWGDPGPGVPGDEDSVATGVRRPPSRFVGFFMFNPAAGDVERRLSRALGEQGLRAVCLFPAMHKYRLDDERVAEVFAPG